jgi:hypothetical protein
MSAASATHLLRLFTSEFQLHHLAKGANIQ